MNKIKVLLVDDHEIVRIGLASLLAGEKDIELVGEAEDGEGALRLAAKSIPDVVIMDLMMPGMDGVQTTTELLRRLPDVKVIILTSYTTSDDLAHALETGAKGALLKASNVSSLVPAIRSVYGGKTFISPEIKRLIANDPPIKDLSPRQLEVLHAITRGLTNAEIARLLGVCTISVEKHTRSLFAKLGAANRAEAVAIALRKHLLKI